MSGVYLIVWDDKSPDFDRILKPTSGGWPHVTMAYTGDHLTKQELVNVSQKVFDKYALSTLELTSARVNKFFHKGENKDRFDVLLDIHNQEALHIEDSCDKFFRNAFPGRHSDFFMMKPHVTAKICWSQEEADKVCDDINKLLPHKVTVTGVTID